MPLGALALLVLASGGAAGASPPAAESFSWAGSCEQAAAVVLVDADRLRRHVDPGFDLVEAGGQAPLLVTGIRCTSALAGELPYRNLSGLIAAFTSHPEDPFVPPGHGYDILWQWDDPRLSGAFRRGGYATERVPGLRYRDTAGGARFDATDSRRAPFRLRIDRVTNPGPPLALTTYHWHAGRRGRVMFEADHSGFGLDPGIGRVRVPARSLLARIIDGTHATGAGGILTFDFTAEAGPA